jgi:hypothetical protein
LLTAPSTAIIGVEAVAGTGRLLCAGATLRMQTDRESTINGVADDSGLTLLVDENDGDVIQTVDDELVIDSTRTTTAWA